MLTDDLELWFIVRRALYFEWLGKPDPKNLPPTSPSQKRKRGDNDDEGVFQMELDEEVESRSYSNGSGFGGSTITGKSSISSDDTELQDSLRNYMVNFFNYTLLGSPKTPSVLGVVRATEAKFGTYEGWQVQEDASVTAHRDQYADLHGKQLDDIKEDFHVGGAEVVYPVLPFQEESVWAPLLD
jgi:hypothetical protein